MLALGGWAFLMGEVTLYRKATRSLHAHHNFSAGPFGEAESTGVLRSYRGTLFPRKCIGKDGEDLPREVFPSPLFLRADAAAKKRSKLWRFQGQAKALHLDSIRSPHTARTLHGEVERALADPL